MQRDNEKLEKQMLEEFTDLQGNRVLEIGCGDGRVTEWLAGKAKAYTAIDPDSQSISEARTRINGVDFRVGSGEDLEFESASFDVAVFTLSLHHQDSVLALAGAHRVLRENGQLVVLEPAADGELQQFFNVFDDEREAQENALEAMASADFELERQETFSTHWTFENKEDVYRYDFGGPETGPDASDIEKMNGLLGTKLNDEPIHMMDKLNIFSFRKRG